MPQNLPKTLVKVRVVTRYSPIHGTDIGTYLQVAIPNAAGHRFGKPCMSWERPYKVYPDSIVTGEHDLARVLSWLDQKFMVTM